MSQNIMPSGSPHDDPSPERVPPAKRSAHGEWRDRDAARPPAASSSDGKLRVLVEAELLSAAVHTATEHFARGPDATVCDQARRAALSVASNIAEGNGKRPGPDRLRMLDIARGSLRELESQLRHARRIRLIDPTGADELLTRCVHVTRLLSGLQRWCRRLP